MIELYEKYKHSLSIAYFFLMIGVVMGNWVARIPDIKREHELSDLSFGSVLVCSIVGGLLSFPVVGTFAAICGSKGGVVIGTVSLIILTPIIGFPYKSIWILGTGITGLGFGWGILEVSINTQASMLEKVTRKHWMGLFQGTFSIGCWLGALFGGICTTYDMSPFVGFLCIVIAAIPSSLFFRLNLFSREDERLSYDETLRVSSSGTTYGSMLVHQKDVDVLDSVPDSEEVCESSESGMFSAELTALCGIALISAMADGSIGDWSTIFMTTKLGMSDFTAALGYSLCALTVAFGRIYSDYLRHHFDSPDLLMCSGILATCGLVLFSTSSLLAHGYTTRVVLSYFGICIAGAGVSISSPVILSLAGRLPGIAPAKAIAMVTTPAYLGYLIGPPLIGFLSYSLDGLNWALLFCSFFMLLIPLFSVFLTRRGPSMSRCASLASNLNFKGNMLT